MNPLGGIRRPKDFRDVKLGQAVPPIPYPATSTYDISSLPYYWQNGWPECGAFAGTHLEVILRAAELGNALIGQGYSPTGFWKVLKKIDGIPPEQGTDMRSIFKALMNPGVFDYNLLPTNYSATLAQSTDYSEITQEMLDNAQDKVISGYAFLTSTDLESVKQAAYQHIAVLLLVDVNTQGGNWWNNPFPVFDPKAPKSGHFIVAYKDYDDKGISIIDSADKVLSHKKLNSLYPIREGGTVVNVPKATMDALIQKKAWMQQIYIILQTTLKLPLSVQNIVKPIIQKLIEKVAKT